MFHKDLRVSFSMKVRKWSQSKFHSVKHLSNSSSGLMLFYWKFQIQKLKFIKVTKNRKRHKISCF